MPGGLLNLISKGSEDVHFITNPTKTFFKCSYSKYTNFGKQKFRINPEQYSNLKLNTDTKLTFKFPRYAELLTDTYLIIKLPHIWSPIYQVPANSDTPLHWRPYEFKWIENLGSQIVKNMKFYIGGQLIQEFSGHYLQNLVERDFPQEKKELYYQMTGNIPELNDPANAFGRNNVYPNAFYPSVTSAWEKNSDDALWTEWIENYKTYGVEPSIRGRNIYIPINIWFTLLNKMALPLVSMQYVECWVDIELRPISELFVVKDIDVDISTAKYISPNKSDDRYSFYKFIHNPPQYEGGTVNVDYPDKRTEWNCDIHLSSTYIFLGEDQQRVFAQKSQQYLIKEVYQYLFHNTLSSKKVLLNNSHGMISSWMWFFQRTDVNNRNQWSNYTNWDYNTLPYNIIVPNEPTLAFVTSANEKFSLEDLSLNHSYYFTPNNTKQYLPTTGYYRVENQKTIMNKWGLIFDGKYRENDQYDGILSYVEKYKCSSGYSSDCLYSYNFCLNTNPFEYQPSGAINTSAFNNIEFEFDTIKPPFHYENISSHSKIQCTDNGEVIPAKYPMQSIYKYDFNLYIIEERYNILTFSNGNVSLAFSR